MNGSTPNGARATRAATRPRWGRVQLFATAVIAFGLDVALFLLSPVGGELRPIWFVVTFGITGGIGLLLMLRPESRRVGRGALLGSVVAFAAFSTMAVAVFSQTS